METQLVSLEMTFKAVTAAALHWRGRGRRCGRGWRWGWGRRGLALQVQLPSLKPRLRWDGVGGRKGWMGDYGTLF